jgi:outer membrane beta-barrel protein
VNRPVASRAPWTALLLLAAALPLAARAGNKADAFEGKIKPISGQLYEKAGRFEITPVLALSLEDAFFTKYLAGLRVGYHVNESLAVALAFAAGTTSPTGSAVVCPANQGCRPASAAELYQVPGRIRSTVSADVAWTPVYGKLNLVAEQVAHFDLGLVGGADLVIHDALLSANQAMVLGQKPSSRSGVGGHVGLAIRLFLGETLAIRWEVRDLIYAVDVPNIQESGKPRSDIQNQLFTELGLSIFFGRGGRSP